MYLRSIFSMSKNLKVCPIRSCHCGYVVRRLQTADNKRKQSDYGCYWGRHRSFKIWSRLAINKQQWLKCNGTQGNAVPPPPIYGSKRSPTSDCYNARDHCQRPKPECSIPPPLILHFNHWQAKYPQVERAAEDREGWMESSTQKRIP